MNKDVVEKLSKASKAMTEVQKNLLVYINSLSAASEAFESLASTCAVVISQPYIEVGEDVEG